MKTRARKDSRRLCSGLPSFASMGDYTSSVPIDVHGMLHATIKHPTRSYL